MTPDEQQAPLELRRLERELAKERSQKTGYHCRLIAAKQDLAIRDTALAGARALARKLDEIHSDPSNEIPWHLYADEFHALCDALAALPASGQAEDPAPHPDMARLEFGVTGLIHKTNCAATHYFRKSTGRWNHRTFVRHQLCNMDCAAPPNDGKEPA